MSRLRFVPLLAALLASGFATAHAADAVKTRAAIHDHFGRMAFDWPAPVAFDASVDGLTATIHFARPLSTDLRPLLHALGSYVEKASLDADGSTLTLTLKRAVTLKTLTEGNTVAIDLVEAPPAVTAPAPALGATKSASTPEPAPASAPAPSQAASTQAPAAAPTPAPTAAPAPSETVASQPPADKNSIGIRAGEHEGFSRVVLEWKHPVRYTLSEQNEGARIHFVRPVDIDATQLAAAVAGLAAQVTDEGGGTTLRLFPPVGTHLRHSGGNAGIVLDFVRDKNQPSNKVAAPSAGAKPAGPAGVSPPPELIDPASGAGLTVPLPPAPGSAPAHKASAAADPVPAMEAHYSANSDIATLRFSWHEVVPAAVYRRGGTLWVIFAAPTKADLSEVELRGKAAIEKIEQVSDPAATVLRIRTRKGLEPSVRRLDNDWVLDFKAQELHPDVPITVAADAAAHRIVFEMRAPAVPIAFADPEVGDHLLIVPTVEIGRGLASEAGVVDVNALVSLQGLVLRPNREGVAAKIVPTGIEVTGPKGLLLSDETDRRLGTAGNVRRLFDFAAWREHGDQSFLDRRSELERKVASVPPSARSQSRLALAEFYFAQGYAAETLGVLDAIERDDPHFATDRLVRAIKGAAELLNDNLDMAAQELGRPGLDGEPEVALWRGSLAAANGDWPTAAKQFTSGIALLTSYPKKMRNRLALQAAEALIRTDQAQAAGALIDLVERDRPGLGDHAMAQYLVGLQAQAEGDLTSALETWQQVATLNDRPSRARALKDRTLALLDAGKISRSDAIQQLDGLRFSWRGGTLEFELLQSLGTLLLADGDVRRGLDVLSQAVGNFPQNPATPRVKQQMVDAFTSVFTGKIANEVSPLKALALYDEFTDLVPPGAPGEEIVHHLADRLIAVDLLDQADTLLEDRVTHRLAGVEKAHAATELALIRLLDHRPDAAVKALDISVDGNLPIDLVHRRAQLRAHALADLGKPKEALAALDGDSSKDADRMRADIYWKTQDWADAAQVFERLVPVATDGAKLGDGDAHLVLNWAAALTLAGDRAGLARLNQSFGTAMAGTSFASAFQLITGDDSAVASAGPRERAKQLAEIDQLKDFAAKLRTDIAADKAGAIN